MQRNILVVDDEINAREGLTKLLQRSGYEVSAAENGFEALKKVKNNTYDLIITDIRMPEMGGMQLLKEIKGLVSGMGVIMITAFGEVESYLEAMDLGAFEYMSKPINVDELKKVIWKLLGEE